MIIILLNMYPAMLWTTKNKTRTHTAMFRSIMDSCEPSLCKG